MGLPVPQRSRELTPYIQRSRPHCPFYGFNGMFGVLMDSEGNQCALITNVYSPCQMEMKEQTPDWFECPFNTEGHREKLAKVLNDLRVFPKEFHPPGQASWGGVSLINWIRYINDGMPMTEE